MNDNTEQDKKNKSGSPLFIIIIFTALIVFLFLLPTLYKKFEAPVAEFLGIGSTKEDTQEPEEEASSPASDFYQISANETFTYNELTITNYYLENGKFTIDLKVDDEIDLDKAGYYLEFYEGKRTFIGRRSLKGSFNKEKSFAIDVSNLSLDSSTYFTISHISDDAIGGVELESDESGISELVCSKGNMTFTYEFYLKKLLRVTEKYEYATDDIIDFADKLMEYEKKEEEYDELNGVDASIAKESGRFVFLAKFDYSEVSAFSHVQEEELFTKDELDNVVSFKMDAEGYDCK